MKLKEVFEKSVQFFKDKKIDTARLDAEILLSHVLKLDRLQIYLKYEQPLSESEITLCREVVRRRSQGEPVAYITGEKGFYGEIFAVGTGVLIPRPETEQIVEEALLFIQQKEITNARVLDLGAGTGCIGLSILKQSPTATLVSVERSPAAFQYLQKNREALGLVDRSVVQLADVMNFVTDEKFDIIVANPPYIDRQDPLVQDTVKKFEPDEALFAAAEGYQDIADWSKKFRSNLATPGLMLFEIGHQQGAETKRLFSEENLFGHVAVLKDLAGLDRVVKAEHT
ncbi:MAG: peptide chain release factor N(5)-glutamine methyltransferase [Bdellovibrionaceae bacterium]|nr:peptide chain release factor N(5)-glutamine methyltransferase [Pseudobdellovibrionaceae bacterium]